MMTRRLQLYVAVTIVIIAAAAVIEYHMGLVPRCWCGDVKAWLSVALVVVLEVTVGLIIRDNLTLNILMLVHPFEVVKRWQAGG